MKKKIIGLIAAFILVCGSALFGMSDEKPAHPVSWPASLDGKAYEISVTASGEAKAEPVATLLPVLAFAGISADGWRKAYVPLDVLDKMAPSQHSFITWQEFAAKPGSRLVPSGALYVENVSTREVDRVSPDGQYVIAAAWSPVRADEIAYTFSSGSSFGLALANITTGSSRVLRSSGIDADYVAWSSDGGSIDFYTALDAPHSAAGPEDVQPATLERTSVAVASAGHEVSTFSLPLVVRSGAGNVSQGFTVALAGGDTIRGDSLLGLSTLSAYDVRGSLLRTVDANRLVAVLPGGVVYKTNTGNGDDIEFLGEDGTTSVLVGAASAVSFKLPFPAPPYPTIAVTQVGQGYTTVCNLFDHTFANNMAYAYDLFAPLTSPYVLAAGDGSVAYQYNEVTCNSYDTTGCSDYSSTCSSNGGWGNVVVLQHADGSFTKYAHMKYHSILTPGVGTSVGIGCQIGTQGHTGATFSSGTSNPCGDHLHFQRQTSSSRDGVSESIAFSDVSNPLSCTSYSSGNGGRSCVY